MFFEITPDGAGYLQRRQTIDIVLNNVVWVFDREEDLVNALFQPGKNTKYESKYRTLEI